MQQHTQVLEVRRDNLGSTRLVDEAVVAAQAGEVVLRVDAFALTANNITYAVAGDMLGYWQFFPAADAGWGRVPVWGFAEVSDSAVDGIAVGERFYGYFPMAGYLRVQPTSVGDYGFSDGVDHRRELPPVYNQYLRCARDPVYRRDQEAALMLFRPLFTTSFFLEDFLAEQDFFGASAVLLSSASSKTAFGLAWLLHRRHRGRCRVLGLTSAANRDWVCSLGCYDEVFDYADVERQLPHEPLVYVDMAGNRELRGRVHRHLGEQLRYSCAVGITHWEAAAAEEGALPGPAPQMFFAPTQIQKRSKEWGQAGLSARLSEAWVPFTEQVQDWITVRRERGAEALSRAYQEVLHNRAPPATGYVLALD
jgi:hypothetical protein